MCCCMLFDFLKCAGSIENKNREFYIQNRFLGSTYKVFYIQNRFLGSTYKVF